MLFLIYLQPTQYFRMKDTEAKDKKKEYEVLQAENVALEVAEQKLKAREEDRLKKKLTGYLIFCLFKDTIDNYFKYCNISFNCHVRH